MSEATPSNKSVISMQELVKEIARALVDIPDAVTVDAIEADSGTILELRVAQSDIGKVIGKQGRTARSFRTILGAAGMRQQHRYSLDIIEEDEDEDQTDAAD